MVRCVSLYLPGESQPVIFSVHGAIAQHYEFDPFMRRNRVATATRFQAKS
jgi:hypothetical protein